MFDSDLLDKLNDEDILESTYINNCALLYDILVLHDYKQISSMWQEPMYDLTIKIFDRLFINKILVMHGFVKMPTNNLWIKMYDGPC